jgi:hypothetical protein
MDDFSTASTETSTPDVSSSQATDVAAASNTGAGEQTAATQVPQADATAPAAADNGINVGWTLDDEAEVEPNAIPEDDSDLDALQQDPALDPARTPGLVSAIKQARTENRNLSRELAQLKQQSTAFDEYGGFEGVKEGLNLVNQLFMATPENGGTVPVLSTLYQQAFPVYEQLVGDVARSNPDYVIAQLQQLGHLPAQLSQQPSASLDTETLSTIPEHLRDVAKSLPANVMEDLLLQPEEVRDWTLERERKLQEMDANQRQASEQQWNQQVTAAKQQGYEAVANLSKQYEDAHYAQLAKWNPFGPENSESNTRLYKSMVEGAMADLLGDQKFAQMYQDAQGLLSAAPMRKLRNEGAYASQDEMKARGMAAQFNTRLGQMIRARVKEMDSVFKDARAFREQQRQNAPNRTEISGMSTQISGNGKVNALDGKGKISDQYIQSLVERLPRSGG